VTVGASRGAAGGVATIWFGPTTANALGFARAGDDDSVAVDVTADGRFAAGTSQNTSMPDGARQRAFLWRGGPPEIIPPLAGDTGNEALVMSADGSAIAGLSYDVMTRRQRAFWWKRETGSVEVLPPAPPAPIVGAR